MTRRFRAAKNTVTHRSKSASLAPATGFTVAKCVGGYLTDGRLTIDNAAAEQAIRPLAVGRRNWLHLGGDGGLKPTAVLLSIAASVKRQGINPWGYLKHVLTELPARTVAADLTDLLPDGGTCPTVVE